MIVHSNKNVEIFDGSPSCSKKREAGVDAIRYTIAGTRHRNTRLARHARNFFGSVSYSHLILFCCQWKKLGCKQDNK